MDTYNRIRAALIPDVGFHQNHYARTLDRFVRNGVRWVDVGAGTKIHDGYGVPSSADLAQRAVALIGVDPVGDHLAENPYLSQRIIGRADALDLPVQSVDVVTANMVLEHLENPEAVFSEVARVLVPGGLFVFVTPNKDHPIVRVASLALSRNLRSRLATSIEDREEQHVFPTYYKANTRRRIMELAQRAGLDAVEVTVLRNIPFFRRPSVATVLECLWIKACALPPLQRFGADIVGVLRKQG